MNSSDPSDTPPPPQRVTLSQELLELAGRFAERPVQLGEILDATQGRGFNLLLVFIALPFLTPIPLPGFSIPFGLVVALIGARMALGQKPWLPRKLLTRELPPRFLSELMKTASRVVKWLEFFLRPRLGLFNSHSVFRRGAGVLIMLSGCFLIIPLPIPFSNSLPASTVLLLAAAALQRDGLAFLAGCGLFVITTAYFLLLAFGGAQAVERLRRAHAPADFSRCAHHTARQTFPTREALTGMARVTTESLVRPGTGDFLTGPRLA